MEHHEPACRQGRHQATSRESGMVELKQFVPGKVCLSCDGCCRYGQKETVWAPFFLYDEILKLTEKNIIPSSLFTHADAAVHKPARINLVGGAGQFICSCFEPAKNTCKIYEYRPLDCRLYPFIIARRGEKVFLTLDEKCPYTKKMEHTKIFKDYVAALLSLFASEDFIRLMKSNPGFIQEYPQDLRVLEPLPQM